jgi:hypothetical protein
MPAVKGLGGQVASNPSLSCMVLYLPEINAMFQQDMIRWNGP